MKFPIPIGRVMALGDDRNVFFSGYGEGNTEGFLNLATGQSTPLDRGDTRLIYSGEKAYAPFLIGINKAHDSLGIFFPNGKSATAKLNPSISFGPLISGNAEALNFSGSQITIGKSKGANLTPYKIALNLSSMTVNYVLLDQAAEEAFTKGFQNPFNQRFATRSSGDMAYIQLAELERVTSATIGLSPVQNNQQADQKPSESGIIPKSTRLGPSEGQIEFSAQNDIVVYQDAGSLLFRVIQPIDPAAARQLGMDIVKKKLLSKVKQVGIGFIIYGSDNDDVLPGAEGWENKLMPYMKNRELMNDFNYTFRGGDMTQINDPAGTELGFAVGPGGRAVVYMDGHAKWMPNP